MGKLDGKVAWVTGGARGIGRASALRLAAEGAALVVSDLDEDAARACVAEIEAAGGRGLPLALDVTVASEVRAAVARAVEAFGRLDVAVANAGVVEPYQGCLGLEEAQFDRTIAVNLKGVFLTLQAAARCMVEQGRGGRLIALSSIMSQLGAAGTPAYCASKGGVTQLVRSFAIECAPHGITVNAVGPGFIDTDMTAPLQQLSATREAIVSRIPAGRFGTPDDVAQLIAFLASPEAAYVNGALLHTDGALMAGIYNGPSRRG